MVRMLFVKGKEMKGKPWTVEEEKLLRELLAEKKSIRVIARTIGKSRDCIRQKVMRLGLEVVEQEKKILGVQLLLITSLCRKVVIISRRTF